MKIRHLLGTFLLTGSLVFLSACGDDNDTAGGAPPTAAPPTATSRPTTAVPPTATVRPTTPPTIPPTVVPPTLTPVPTMPGGATLTSDIGAGDTTITVSDASGLPDSGFVRIDDEVIQYTGKSGNTLTGVTRGAAGTVAAPHLAGAAVSLFVPVATATPTVPVPTPSGEPRCGNSAVDSGEECDDGNNFGGDGCAANCTTETKRLFKFAANTDCTGPGTPNPCCTGEMIGNCTGATVQTALFPVPLGFSGSLLVTGGDIRSGEVRNAAGEVIFNDGEIPVAVQVADIAIDPVKVPGLVCACVRGIEVPEFGPGNAGAGRLGCGGSGLSDINVSYEIDHNTNDVDPSCANGVRVEDGTTDENNDGIIDHPHAGVCNGAPVISLSGGQAPRGSALVRINTAIALISDGGTCCTVGVGGCPSNPAKGPDGIPCTGDDPDLGTSNNLPTTTATASGCVRDANNLLGQSICGGPGQTTTIRGKEFKCDAILASETGGLSGGALVNAFGAVDAASIGDNVVTVQFIAE